VLWRLGRTVRFVCGAAVVEPRGFVGRGDREAPGPTIPYSAIRPGTLGCGVNTLAGSLEVPDKAMNS
jgi:hypothetical protein